MGLSRIDLLALALSCSLSGARAPAQELGAGLDGGRGFGPAPDPRVIENMFRSAKGDAAKFLSELFELRNEVELLVIETRTRYGERGYFSILDAEPSFEALHRRFTALESSPFLRPMSREAATALAEMFADAHFRVRRHVLEGVEREMHELDGALALFQAHTRGVASLEAIELTRVAARADLAAAVLRAIRKDLRLLQRDNGAPIWRSQELMAVLVEALQKADRTARGTFDQQNVRWRSLVRRMLVDLETTRLQSRLQQELGQRDKDSRKAQAVLRQLRTLLPFTPQGAAAPPAILEMKKAERYRLAIATGLEGVRLAPFDEELNFLLGEAYDYIDGEPFSRIYFDRFLALRGIRSYDYESFGRRDLDASEERALWVVSRFRAGASPQTPGGVPR